MLTHDSFSTAVFGSDGPNINVRASDFIMHFDYEVSSPMSHIIFNDCLARPRSILEIGLKRRTLNVAAFDSLIAAVHSEAFLRTSFH
jgi:hypothetical protein